MLPKQALQFGHKLPDVFEVEVNGGKADVCHLIQFFQTSHEQFANFARRTLALRRIVNEPLHFVDERLKSAGRHRTLLAGFEQTL